MKTKLKNEKGITLIALVITIIVLLILAGVTISLTLGENGIFKTAEQAVKNYTNAQNKEMADIGNFGNTVDNIIEDITGNKLSNKAKLGDYVKYTPTAKTFSMTPEQTGQEANQDFNTVDYKDENGNPGLWQVLYNDDERGLQIISADIVGELTLGNSSNEAKTKIGYNNAVNTLNTFCSNYVNTKYATSGRSVGSNPINSEDTLDLTKTEDRVTLKFTYNDSTESGCKIPDENYIKDWYAMLRAKSQNANGISGLGKPYWLASRDLLSWTYVAEFSVRTAKNDGNVTSYYLWRVGAPTDNKSYTYGVRPVVKLKSDIQRSTGDGSKTNPFELAIKEK